LGIIISVGTLKKAEIILKQLYFTCNHGIKPWLQVKQNCTKSIARKHTDRQVRASTILSRRSRTGD